MREREKYKEMWVASFFVERIYSSASQRKD